VEDPGLVREVFENTIQNLRSAHLVVREDFVISNHVNDLKDISRKSLLFLTIQQYLKSEQGKREVGNKTVIPFTYLLNGLTFDADLEAMIQDKEERDFKFETPLIIKPGQFSNRGIGISLAFRMSEAVRLCKETLEFKKNTCSVIVQEYITRPLLYKERKFDIRCYALVVRLFDRISYYWYSRGYVRTSSFAYDSNAQDNLKVHLTNEAVQVKGNGSDLHR
jgi:Tubulin-tyrosine ligase family